MFSANNLVSHYSDSIAVNYTPLTESISLDDLYHRVIKDISKHQVKMHKAFIDSQKTFFKSLQSDNTNLSLSKILFLKIKTYTNFLFDYSNISSNSFLDYLFSKNKDTSSQILFINKVLYYEPHLGLLSVYMEKDIQFKTKSFDDFKSNYRKATITFLHDHPWSKNKVTKSDLYNSIPYRYINKDEMKKYMEKNLEIYQKHGRFNIVEIIKLHDDYAKDIKKYVENYKSMLYEVKQELKGTILEVKKSYREHIDNIVSDSTISPNDKEEIIEISTHNFKVYTDVTIEISNILIESYKYQYKILINSLKPLINAIDDSYSIIYEYLKKKGK